MFFSFSLEFPYSICWDITLKFLNKLTVETILKEKKQNTFVLVKQESIWLILQQKLSYCNVLHWFYIFFQAVY